MDSQSALLLAVQDRLRTALGYTATQCAVEYDELPPAIASHFYVSIIPGPVTPGPHNQKSGGVLDEIVEFAVAVVNRAPRLPRDRSRGLMLDEITGLNTIHKLIRAEIHFDYDLINAASLYCDETSSLSGPFRQGFSEPAKFAGLSTPAMVGAEYFAGHHGEERAGLKRIARYSGARRIQTMFKGPERLKLT